VAGDQLAEGDGRDHQDQRDGEALDEQQKGCPAFDLADSQQPYGREHQPGEEKPRPVR